MKNALNIVSRTLLLLAIAVMPNLSFDHGGIPPASANDEASLSANTAKAGTDAPSSAEEAVLHELNALLSEDYCPDYDVKKWDFFGPAPACLQEQAKKIAVLVYGPSEFSEEEEQRLRKLVASGKEVQAKLKEVGCKPGVVQKWLNDGQVDAPPECMQIEAKILQEQARKDGRGPGKTIIQAHVEDTKFRHLEDLDRLHLLLAQVLSQYACDTSKNTGEECVLNFYNSIKSKG